MNVLDLFSGIGGFSLGLERAGMRTVAFCEVDGYARRVLAKHWPGVPCIDDVRTDNFPDADVISAGFPCQDISFAGDGAGLAGERSGLYREVIRAIRLVRPDYALLENVAALLSRGLDTVLGDLAEVGYDAEWHCIPASAVGAPHRRDRIWIIAHAGGEQHESGRAPFSGAIAEGLFEANLAHAEGEWRDGCRSGAEPAGRDQSANGSEDVADTASERRGEAWQLRLDQPQEWAASRSKALADASLQYEQGQLAGGSYAQERSGSIQRQTGSCGDGDGWWSVEPDVGRVAHGVPSRVDRLRCLGNAVVPQIPEIIGRAIMRAER
jgi:DNA (cytosine-5)-methyltransferase 1